jgi:hypothetical protein
VFVLADSSRPQTRSFIPTSTQSASCTPKLINSPIKARSMKKDQATFSICQIGARPKDDATFLALLHIEQLVDRDLFRCSPSYLSCSFYMGIDIRPLFSEPFATILRRMVVSELLSDLESGQLRILKNALFRIKLCEVRNSLKHTLFFLLWSPCY